jgi:hypothetical protein
LVSKSRKWAQKAQNEPNSRTELSAKGQKLSGRVRSTAKPLSVKKKPTATK